MALSQHQRDILLFVGDKEVATKDIVEKFKGKYYNNGRHHVYERIARLVKRGFLIRVSHGVYRRGSGKKTYKKIDDGSQLKLF